MEQNFPEGVKGEGGNSLLEIFLEEKLNKKIDYESLSEVEYSLMD